MLVIGIGNPMRGDDGVGICAVRKIRALNLPDVTAIEHSGEGAWLMELWKNQQDVIVIDATRSQAAPGTICRFEAHRYPLPVEVFGWSTHMVGLPAAIELSRTFGELPANLVVYGIEGKTFDINLPISREASLAIDTVCEQIVGARFIAPCVTV